MPYVHQERRHGPSPTMEFSGDLNYQITLLLIAYTKQHGLSYETINAALGAVDAAGKEYYRRVADPYENTAIVANGDVYPQELTSGKP